MIDKINIEILNLLQQNARMSASEIASDVGLSVPAAAERVKKLAESKLITGYYTKLDAKELGFDLCAFITVDSASSDHYHDIIDEAERNTSVLECHSVTGEGSHLLKIRIKNSTELEKLLSKIQSWPGVIRTHTMLVLSTFKETTEIDLDELTE
ncbi:MAG: Lrp/AsnC family transcriptional regulator [Candidatus Neomarinimicrobiota bacterium]